MNSLTQPTEHNKRNFFAISICIHSTTLCGVSQKSALLHTRPLYMVTSTTTKQARNFAGISVQKLYQFIKKKKSVFSS